MGPPRVKDDPPRVKEGDPPRAEESHTRAPSPSGSPRPVPATQGLSSRHHRRRSSGMLPMDAEVDPQVLQPFLADRLVVGGL